MARIDNYLKSMERFGAAGLNLSSDSHVVLKFPSGDRHATQTTPHALLEALVKELVNGHSVLSRGEGTLSYDFENKSYAISVTSDSGKLRVLVEPTRTLEGSVPSLGHDGVYLGTSATFTGAGNAAPVAALDDAAFGTPAPRAAEPEPEPLPPPPKRFTDPPKPSPHASAEDTEWLHSILGEMIIRGVSDLHLSSGTQPYWRLDGEMATVPGQDQVLDPEWLQKQVMAIAPPLNRKEYLECNDTDFAYNVEGLSRFRVNVFRDRKGPGAVLRTIPFEIPSAEKLGIPECILDLANLTKGLVVVTGPTGSGKSTTLASLIDYINTHRASHLITIEDPIEFVHPNKKCLINQREITTHTGSFKRALRAALREDPDIVLVGEMRDLETIEIAVETAETGHLVFGTLHTTTAPATVDRIIDQFPPDRQEQIRQMLAKSLKAVVAQVLCRRKGGGRVAAHEILLGTSAVENLIRERKTFQLFSIMQTGRNLGMQTMEDALLKLVKNDEIEALEAYQKSVNKSEMKNALQRAGHKLE